MSNKLVVLSMDAMVTEDLEYLRTKPNFRKLFENSAQIGKVCTVYPSLTYPAHTSIITGCRPGKHGVYENSALNTDIHDRDHWFVRADQIKCDDLFRAARRAGKTTAAIYWPVTGNHPAVDRLLPEVFAPFFPNRDIMEVFRELGTTDEMMAIVDKNMYRFPKDNRDRYGLQRYNSYDHFLTGCAADVIRSFRPDLTMIHNSYLDTARHRYGVFNAKVTEGLDYTDCWLGELIDALESAGIYDRTNFVLVSDHGQIDIARRLRLSTKLVRDGWIRTAEDGSVTSWDAFAKSTGMSVVIYLRDPNDKALYEKVYDYLKRLRDEGVWGFEKIRTMDEAQADYGLTGPYSFILETDGYTGFGDSWQEPICNPRDFTNYRLGTATHGYEPEKGPQPVFVAAGPDFRPGAFIERTAIINEGPTFARILGTDLKDAEGTVLSELLA